MYVMVENFFKSSLNLDEIISIICKSVELLIQFRLVTLVKVNFGHALKNQRM